MVLRQVPGLRWDRSTNPDGDVVVQVANSRCFVLGNAEFAVLSLVDGRRTTEEICDAIPPPNAPEWSRNVLSELQRCGLVEPAETVAPHDITRSAPRRWHFAVGQVRLDLWNPTGLLDVAARRLRWLRIGSHLRLLSLLLLPGSVIAGLYLPQLVSLTMNQLQRGPVSLVVLAVILFCLSVLHELGHAVACRVLDTPVRSIGVMLFYLQPMLYCDVTPMWTLPDRRHRAFICAAGVYVQMLLGSVLLSGWWILSLHGHPLDVLGVLGLVNFVFCLFNLIPLVRLDGYFILTSLADWPNLYERSRESVLHAIGLRPVESLRFPDLAKAGSVERIIMAGFAIASTIFSIVLWGSGAAFLASLYTRAG